MSFLYSFIVVFRLVLVLNYPRTLSIINYFLHTNTALITLQRTTANVISDLVVYHSYKEQGGGGYLPFKRAASVSCRGGIHGAL